MSLHYIRVMGIKDSGLKGPFKEIVTEMAGMFLAGYTGPPDGDLDHPFAEYIIKISHGQGQILEWAKQPLPQHSPGP